MRVSYNWLKEYVDVRMAPERLGELLTMSGVAVESMQKTADDCLFEIEITSNRPDCLSVIGIAREVAALTGKKLKVPYSVSRTAYSDRCTAHRAPRTTVNITVEDRRLCPRYTGRVIEGVKIAAAPQWLTSKIRAMGLRPVNNIVDITNFCLFELGEPMHAFDLDKISGREVIVRRARKGEKSVTIDGVERPLDDTVLVIADRDKPIAIAGVMGGANTEVNASTKAILLEAAIFDPVSIRRTSRRLGISTESSYRFERRIDPESVLAASSRACELIVRDAGGKAGALVDCGPKAHAKRPLTLRYCRLNDTVGVEIPRQTAKEILTSLGCKIKNDSPNGVEIEPPSFRQDIEGEIDLIEEVARIYGYHRIPATIPDIPDDGSRRVPLNLVMESRIRALLAAEGLCEILTYSLMSKRDVAAARTTDSSVLEVANPLSAEQEAMRPSLIPGLLRAIGWNVNREARELRFFELGTIYRGTEANGTREMRYLSIGLSGESQGSWRTQPRELDFFDLKGILETLMEGLGLDGAVLSGCDHELFSKQSSASIVIEGTHIGFIGEIAPRALTDHDLKQRVYALELSVDELLKRFTLHSRYREPPKYPAVTRDLSIVVDKGIENSRIVSLIKAKGGSILKDIELIDRYMGAQIPDGKIGLTYRLDYLDPSKTLEDSQVNSVHSAIYQSLAAELGAALRQ